MASETPDYYKVLGVGEKDTQDEIKRAWRKLAVKYHPDAQQGKSDAEKKQAEDKMKAVNEAYSVLGDEEKRKTYDQFRMNPFAGATQGGGTGYGNAGGTQYYTTTSGNWADILNQMFGGMGGGGGFRTSPMGVDYDLADILNGMGGGYGTASGNMYTGRGGGGRDVNAELDVPLETLLAGGEVSALFDGKEINLKIKKGTRSGTKLRLRGRGAAGANGKSGDLYVTLKATGIEPGTEIRGDDVVCAFRVPFDVAILGGTVTKRLPNGKTIKLKVPEDTQAGKQFSISGAGFGRSGKCVLVTEITVPRSTSKKVKDAIRGVQGDIEH